MASNQIRWIRNLLGAPSPFVMLGLFQAGSTQAIKRGEVLELSGGNWIPLDANQVMAAIIAVANEEVKAGDRAGYYEIIVPRPGDVFEYDLDTAAATAVGTALYWSSSEVLTATAGAGNVLAYAVGQEHYPLPQGHLADDASGDSGVTVRSQGTVHVAFVNAASYWAALIK